MNIWRASQRITAVHSEDRDQHFMGDSVPVDTSPLQLLHLWQKRGWLERLQESEYNEAYSEVFFYKVLYKGAPKHRWQYHLGMEGGMFHLVSAQGRKSQVAKGCWEGNQHFPRMRFYFDHRTLYVMPRNHIHTNNKTRLSMFMSLCVTYMCVCLYSNNNQIKTLRT